MTRENLISVGIDYDSGIARFCGHAQLYEKYLAKFFVDSPFEELKSVIEASDYETAFKIVHDLKATTGNLSAVLLYKKTCELTELLRGGERGAEPLRLCNEACELFNREKCAVNA